MARSPARWRTAARSRPTSSWSLSGVARPRVHSGSRSSGSSPASRSRSTSSCEPSASTAAGCTRSATATAGPCSPTWASTKPASPPTSSPDAAARLEADDAVPRVTFTDPQVAAVGLTEAQAGDAGPRGAHRRARDRRRRRRLRARERHHRARRKLVIDDERGVIVGATFTGPGVQELLHSATIAIVGEVPLDPAVARRPVVPHRQRGLAPPPRDRRPVGGLGRRPSTGSPQASRRARAPAARRLAPRPAEAPGADPPAADTLAAASPH